MLRRLSKKKKLLRLHVEADVEVVARRMLPAVPRWREVITHTMAGTPDIVIDSEKTKTRDKDKRQRQKTKDRDKDKRQR